MSELLKRVPIVVPASLSGTSCNRNRVILLCGSVVDI